MLSFLRRNLDGSDVLVVVMNLTPVMRTGYRIGVPRSGRWQEVLNSDAGIYGGGNAGNLGAVSADDWSVHGQPHSVSLTLPPLSIVVFAPES